jgi:5-methylthioadenosine/S-adenosylhomocysteine deaminase
LPEDGLNTLIHNATIITVDADRRVIESGALYVEGDRIADIGRSEDLLQHHPNCDCVIDGTRKVVIPGFVNTHSHVGYTLFRGRSEDAGMRGPNGLYFPMSTVVTREERQAVGALTYAEYLRSGITTTLEMEEDADIFAPFVEQLGVRSAMGIQIHDVIVDGLSCNEYIYDPNLRETQLRQAVEFAEEWNGRASGRIRTLMTPNMTIMSSPEQLQRARAAADRLGCQLSIHLGWGPAEVTTVRKMYGKSPFQFAAEQGLLGPDVIAAHCYVISEEDIGVLAKSGASVAHCPLINAVRGYIAPVDELRRQGISVGLGIDNMFADFFDVLRACVLMARVRSQSSTIMMADQVLELATIDGARVLGLDHEIGSLEVGKRADLVVLEYNAFGLTPTLDPIQNLVYHAHAQDVVMVMVDGNVLMEDRKILTADMSSLVEGAHSAAAAAWGRFETKYGGPIAA